MFYMLWFIDLDAKVVSKSLEVFYNSSEGNGEAVPNTAAVGGATAHVSVVTDATANLNKEQNGTI